MKRDVASDFMVLNNEVVRSHMRHLTRAEGFVYCALAMHADNATQTCFPSQVTLAEIAGCTVRAAQKALNMLEARGLIAVEVHGQITQHRHRNHYKLLKIEPRQEEPADANTNPTSPNPTSPNSSSSEPQHELSDNPTRTLRQPNTNPSSYELNVVTKPRTKPSKRAPENDAPFVLPDWMPVEEWSDFDAMRTEMQRQRKRVPWTHRAKKAIVRELGKLREAGDPPADVLNRSVAGGYRGVFSLNGNQSSRKKPAQNISEINHAASFGLEPGQSVGRVR